MRKLPQQGLLDFTMQSFQQHIFQGFVGQHAPDYSITNTSDYKQTYATKIFDRKRHNKITKTVQLDCTRQ